MVMAQRLTRSLRVAGKELMQSRRLSMMETTANVIVGYGAAVVSQYAVFPLFGIYAPASTHLEIGFCFTVASVIRSYAMRRLFTRWEGGR